MARVDAEGIFRRGLGVARVLWAALLTSVVLFAAVAVMVKVEPRVLAPTILGFLGIAAFGAAVASFLVPARISAGAYARRRPEIAEPEGYASFGSASPRFAHPAKAMGQALAIAHQAFILRVALSEAVALIGLQAHMLGGTLTLAAPFFAAGFALVAIRFPTRASLVGPYERAHGARFSES